jgi:glycolate oxidase FAD binding subunit
MDARSFESVVGAAHVAPGGGRLDAAVIEAVVSPASAEEVGACLKLAADAGWAVVARGGGSKLHWGNPLAAARALLLDTTRLVEPFDVQAEEGIAELAAGVRLEELERALARAGKQSLLDPLHPDSTVGGAIAADPIGLEYSLDRRPGKDLLGIEVVLAGGQIARAGGRVVKNVTGFDLVRLYCGSLGTLGVITRACVRLRALPEAVRVLTRPYADATAALGGAGSLRAAGVEPAGAVLRSSDRGAELLWRLAGSEAAVARAAARFAGDEVEAQVWDALREALHGAESDERVALRLAARPTDTSALCAALLSHGGRLRLALPLAGVVFGDLPASALDAAYAQAGASGWALFVERAPAELRARFDAFGPASGDLDLMRALKRRFDPDGRLAPGRFAGRC